MKQKNAGNPDARQGRQRSTAEEAEKLWEEIEHIREAEGRKLSKDELDAVSAGFGFDFPSGCTLFFSA